MKPLYCRIGSKYLMASEIISHFPEHIIYVEPFIGGGGVFWSKEKSDIEIINDLDKDLINDYKLIKKSSSDKSKYRQFLNTVAKKEAFLNKIDLVIQDQNNEDKLTAQIIRRCGGFGSQLVGKSNKIYTSSNPYSKLKNIKDYKNRIKETFIKNEDYKKIIRDYDSVDTLFSLDPPYEDSKGLYKNSDIDYEEMASILKNIKGMFLLSLNGSPYIKKIFKDFKIKQIKLKTVASHESKIGSKKRVELLIMNF